MRGGGLEALHGWVSRDKKNEAVISVENGMVRGINTSRWML